MKYSNSAFEPLPIDQFRISGMDTHDHPFRQVYFSQVNQSYSSVIPVPTENERPPIQRMYPFLISRNDTIAFPDPKPNQQQNTLEVSAAASNRPDPRKSVPQISSIQHTSSSKIPGYKSNDFKKTIHIEPRKHQSKNEEALKLRK